MGGGTPSCSRHGVRGHLQIQNLPDSSQSRGMQSRGQQKAEKCVTLLAANLASCTTSLLSADVLQHDRSSMPDLCSSQPQLLQAGPGHTQAWHYSDMQSTDHRPQFSMRFVNTQQQVLASE